MNPAALLREARIPADIETDPDSRISASAVYALYEAAAKRSGADDFGARLSELRDFSNLGVVALAARDEPTVGGALESIVDHLALHNDTISVRINERDGVTWLVNAVREPGCGVQALDVLAGMEAQILRRLLGSTWDPAEVCFERPSPRDQTVFRRVFGYSLLYAQTFSGVAVKSEDLARPNPLAEKGFRGYTRALLLAEEAAFQGSLSEATRAAMEDLLPRGRCSAARVASRLGISSRTLSRGLKEEGTHFLALLDGLRKERAWRAVAESRRPTAAIAEEVGFASASAFSTWFRSRFQACPREVRSAAEREAVPDLVAAAE